MKLNNPQARLDKQAIDDFLKSNSLFAIKSNISFTDTVYKLHKIATIADRIVPIKTYLDLVHDLQKEDNTALCSDDEFLASCYLLKLEISLFSAVYFMKGISIDFKETKFNRNQIDLNNGIILADLRHKLSKPNEIRGAVESNTIQTCYTRLMRRLNLHLRAPEIIKRIQFGISKQEVMREFGLTLTDFEIVYKIAQRENMIQPGSKKRDTEYTKYSLNIHNQNLLQEYANSTRLSAQEVLNDIVEKFFMQLNKKKSNKKSLNEDA